MGVSYHCATIYGLSYQKQKEEFSVEAIPPLLTACQLLSTGDFHCLAAVTPRKTNKQQKKPQQNKFQELGATARYLQAI